MGELSHVIYRSRAAKVFSDEELIDMLHIFRNTNASLNITGMLLYDESAFFQVIEGDNAVISKLYDSIKKDSRHHMVTTLVSEVLQARAFSNWSMGFSKVNNKQLNDMQEVNDFFTSKKCLANVDLGIAKKILQFFACKHSV